MKKVLIAILVIIILACAGVGGYFAYVKIIQPKMEERNQQDMQSVDALGSLLNQPESEQYETMLSDFDGQQVSDDGDILLGQSGDNTMKSAPTTEIPISDDSTVDEALAYLDSLSESEAYDIIAQVMESGNEISDFVRLKSSYSTWNYMVIDKEYIDSHDMSNWKNVYNEAAKLFQNDDKAEKKIEIVQGVMTKYASSETKQQFEYYGIQTGRYIVALEPDYESVSLWYVDEDNIETIVNQSGYLAYLVMRIAGNGDMQSYASDLSDIIPLMQSIESTCSSNSRYKLYTTLRTAIEYVNSNLGSVQQNPISEDGDIFGNDNQSGIGETLEESGQL